ncbi:cellulosome enzyme, dockerin type I [Monoraphidium neglectum]|uniref:Cellulosome enzyme, dockerin type I n=1 Tax=Monoraphidium neglectum TaxID=145388 RepID=A0A0D2JUI0_9CHLO|nr:cellulosome enzyme, dockerin type I [Monoraphidium neglectum]KIZ02518.1 cellulosome enzyme, dockerin type I [Monoraphidium neglectum]|eukprot:XP_013901537.1 cellulosome enzyme, dockerin type I [Monoraphidium neglectum]
MEFMYAAPYSNLYTNLRMGNASEPFGWVVRGQDASGYNTFWNLRSDTGKIALPPYTWAPRVTWVDVNGAAVSTVGPATGWDIETSGPVWPENLWLAQRTARKRPLTPVPPTRHYGPGYGCFSNGTKCCTKPTTGCPNCPSNPMIPSELFGCQGELWKATGRIGYEWSWAGYQQGSASIPWVPQVANLKTQFGAKGDGVTDDTAAMLKALDAVQSGVIFLPAGTYIMTAILNWRKPIVLRGEGRDLTKIKFPKSMTELYGNTWVEGKWVGTSQYSHGTGFMNIGGWDPTGRDFSKLSWVSAPAAQGDRILKIGCCASSLAVGQMVRLWMRDPGDGSLMSELHGGLADIAPEFKGYADPVRFLARIAAMGPDWIKLDRTLPVRVDLAWFPEIHRFMPMIDGSAGFEYLTVSFPWTTYPGHFKPPAAQTTPIR